MQRPIDDTTYIEVIYAALMSLWCKYKVSKTEFRNLSRSITENQEEDIKWAKGQK